jgi:ribosomal-protein-alanine N-acetyltransferase
MRYVVSRIRLIGQGDDVALTALQKANREFLAPWEPLRPERYFSLAGQRADIEAALARHKNGDSVPLVILDEHGDVAGRITLSGIVRGAFQSCSVGYWLAKNQTGKGLATQAVIAAVQLAFTELELHRVQAETLPHNTRSEHVLARAGFEQFGLAPRFLKIAGRWQDHLMFQRLNDIG